MDMFYNEPPPMSLTTSTTVTGIKINHGVAALTHDVYSLINNERLDNTASASWRLVDYDGDGGARLRVARAPHAKFYIVV